MDAGCKRWGSGLVGTRFGVRGSRVRDTQAGREFYKKEGRTSEERRKAVYPFLLVTPASDSAPVLIDRPSTDKTGHWDPLRLSKLGLETQLIDYFDWDGIHYIDRKYYFVRISCCRNILSWLDKTRSLKCCVPMCGFHLRPRHRQVRRPRRIRPVRSPNNSLANRATSRGTAAAQSRAIEAISTAAAASQHSPRAI